MRVIYLMKKYSIREIVKRKSLNFSHFSEEDWPFLISVR